MEESSTIILLDEYSITVTTNDLFIAVQID